MKGRRGRKRRREALIGLSLLVFPIPRQQDLQTISTVRRTVVPSELLRQPQDGMPTRASSVGTEEGLVRQQRERSSPVAIGEDTERGAAGDLVC
jgi:hypothetical protein